jgi:hypothetical protein
MFLKEMREKLKNNSKFEARIPTTDVADRMQGEFSGESRNNSVNEKLERN